ncbi:hypothetical protein D3C71_2201110 [compost metagenome]
MQIAGMNNKPATPLVNTPNAKAIDAVYSEDNFPASEYFQKLNPPIVVHRISKAS